MSQALVSVIVVNWNGMKTIRRCIDSLLAQDYPNLEIIIVDNNSTDGSQDKVIALYGAKVRMVENSKNEGFAGGNNSGIRIARGEYIALLNNDAYASPGWVSALVAAMEKDSGTGMCASKIYLDEKEKILDNTGLMIYPDGLGFARGRLEKDAGQFDQEEEILLPSGCAALYRKKMLDEAGLFDERFFAYCEDTDLGLRARWMGWKCVYVPTAAVVHTFSGTAGSASKLKGFLVERNRGWVALKNFPFLFLLRTPGNTLRRLKWQAKAMASGNGLGAEFLKKYSWATGFFVLLKADLSMLAGVPSIWKSRREILKMKKISRKEMSALLRKHQVSPEKIVLGKKS